MSRREHKWTAQIVHSEPSFDDKLAVIVQLADESDYTHRYASIRIRWPRGGGFPGAAALAGYIIVEEMGPNGWSELVTVPRVLDGAGEDTQRIIELAKVLL